MSQFVVALDQGTTSSRAILFDQTGFPVFMHQVPFRQHYPKPGWVEHDPEEIWTSQRACLEECITRTGFEPSSIRAIGITNQRETTLVWDRTTGNPVYPAIVWQDRRTADHCTIIREEGHSEWIREKTGLVPDPYFSATKIGWILANVDGAREKAERGLLAFGTVDTWLLWKLSEGRVHATDASNASRTLLCNLETGEWDSQLLSFFRIPESMVPQIRSSSEIYGHTRLQGVRIPIAGIAGDQQAALFGQGCLQPGMAKNTYGTGCFLLMNQGDKPVLSENQLLTTIAWKLGNKITYALEGSVFVAGALVQWLRDELGIIRSADEIESLAASVESAEGVVIVPAFTGLGAPYWDPTARGTVLGITRGTNRAHIARAALECIAHQSVDVLTAMESDSGNKVSELRADGGACKNNLLMQIQANLLQRSVVRPKILESTALGAACLSGMAIDMWESPEDLVHARQPDRKFEPVNSEGAVAIMRSTWQKAVARSMNWD